ncbi:MAG: SusC/RagA family TonB-linked outer membrane protein [Sphingobacterium sp.]
MTNNYSSWFHFSLGKLHVLWIASFLFTVPLLVVGQQTITVSGTVTDVENGTPLTDVTIRAKQGGSATSTSGNGSYTLEKVAPSDTLVFSSVGYGTLEIAVQNQLEIDAELTEVVSDLDEVVVIGYGTARKRDLTGAVSQVRAEVIENEAPSQMSDMLRGNVAGLSVGYDRNAKGGGSLLLRGRNSLNANTSPLIVLDGAIYGGAWEDINPNDIETIDVLKDASAAAVFGAKSASGVILVTTKKGSEGKPRINFTSNVGIAAMSVHQPVHDAETFVPWRTDVFKSINPNAEPYRFDNPNTLPNDISIEDWLAYDGSSGDPMRTWLRRLNLQSMEVENYLSGNSVDWYDLAFQNGLRQDHNVSVSGRNKDVSYYLGAGYLHNEGIITGDEFKTLRTRANIEANITDFLQVGMSTQFISRDESALAWNWGAMTSLSPWGDRYDEDGNLVWRPNQETSGGINIGYDASHRDYRHRMTSLNSTIFAKLDLPFGITLRTNFTPQLEVIQQYNHNKSSHEGWAAHGGSAYRRNQQTYFWQIDNILNWNKTFAEVHRIDATVLLNAEKFQRWEDRMDADNFDPNDDLGYHGMPSGINPVLGSEDQYSTGDAFMSRLVYTFDDRYTLTGTFRRDGYSAFGQSNPRANFGSIAGAWTFSEESFFNSDWFNYGKLRVSWGSNGNRDIGRYVALADLTTGKYLYTQPDGTVIQVNQFWVNRMRNQDLRWERNTSYNIGLDFGLFNNRLDGTIEAYLSNTTDLLVLRRLPNVMGFDNVMSNMGKVRNRGIEVTLNSNNIERDNFSWRTSVTAQVNRNSIQALYGDLDAEGNELDDIQNRWFIGQPIDAIWDWKALHVYQLGQEEEAERYGLQPGDYKLEDVNDDGLFTNDDRQFIGFSEPRFQWSLRNDFQIYRDFTFSFMMYSLWGHSSPFNWLKSRNGFPDRQSSYQFPYWTPENPSNEWARINSNEGSATGFNTYRKRSFIRLDNVSLAYNVPSKFISRYNLQNLRVYFNVRNAALFAPQWDFWDPEWHPDHGPGPTPRFFTFGLDLTL